MTSAEYLYDLRKRLRKLPPQEVDQAMRYYEEYFAEAGPEGEAEIINRLGTPAQVASAIISDYALKDMGSTGASVNAGVAGSTGGAEGFAGNPTAHNASQPVRKSSSLKTMWIVILAVLASPIAIPVAIALLFVVFAVLIALFCVFLALFVSALVMAVTGLVAVGLSIVALFSQPIDALAMMGVGLICASLGLALGIGTIKLCQLTIKGITWIFARILGKKGGQQ